MDIEQFLSHNWWLLLLFYLWLRFVQKEQRKKAAQQAAQTKARQQSNLAQQEQSHAREKNAQLAATPSPEEQLQAKEVYYDNEIYTFESPVAAEESQDREAREKAYKFVPTEQEGEKQPPGEAEYAFKLLGGIPAFMQGSEGIAAGEYFQQGLPTSVSQAYMSPAEIRRAIITMEILLPPLCRRRRR